MAAVDEKCVASSCAAIIIFAKSKPHEDTHARTHARTHDEEDPGTCCEDARHMHDCCDCCCSQPPFSRSVQTLISFSLSFCLCLSVGIPGCRIHTEATSSWEFDANSTTPILQKVQMGMRTGGKKNSAADVEEEDSYGCEWYRRS